MKSILITGASSGIGAALARHYATAGVTLFLSGRNEDRLEDVSQSCRARGAAVDRAILDTADSAAMRAWIESADDRLPLDLVIANAGISGGTGGVIDGEPEAQVRRIFDVNLTGVLNTVEPALGRMRGRRCGQIAIMSSLAGFMGWPGAPAYSASKGAVRLYGEALRGGMAAKGVKINVICPGFIRTPMTSVNNYRMPFMMDADKAAAYIAGALRLNRGRIAFPFRTYFFAGLLGILPLWASNALATRMPKKPSLGV